MKNSHKRENQHLQIFTHSDNKLAVVVISQKKKKGNKHQNTQNIMCDPDKLFTQSKHKQTRTKNIVKLS